MRIYVQGLLGETVATVVEGRPNRIVRVTADRVLVETASGEQNFASLTKLQVLADRIFDGEEVELPPRGRSAFHGAILALLPEVAFATRPRRFWLRDSTATFGAEYAELFPGEDPATAQEGRQTYVLHRRRERSPILRRLKIEQVFEGEGKLACEVCGFEFERVYGDLGEGFIECHHRTALAAGEERDTSVDELALLCANCHRMIHRTRPMASVGGLRDLLRSRSETAEQPSHQTRG